jgi:two-component system, OmpR family, copper resistance phosphate regulon response regulator CusR
MLEQPVKDNDKLLIVEDEKKLTAFLKKGLEENNYNVELANDGITGKNMALNNYYDLVIIDLNLPGLNGFQLCKVIRESKPYIPILILTATGGIDEKVKGFEYGADDYLLKPFDFKELLVRIKALLKRSRHVQPQSKELVIADLVIDLKEKTITRGGKTIELSAREYSLLEFMAVNKGRLLTRKELTEHVWGIGFDTGTNVVDVYINYLRKKIDNDFADKLIHTRVGLGYVLKDSEDVK